jgi:hypothetical protein
MCSKRLKLTIELVPSTSWFTNLRSLMTERQWDFVRQACYVKARHRCEICNGRGAKHPVECHEVWEYDDKRNTQTLLRTIALCPDCHKVKHIGLQMKIGMHAFERSLTHFMHVNELTAEQAEEYVMMAFAQHHARSQREWTLDVSWIEREYPDYFRMNKLRA